MRPSILLRYDSRTVIVDTGPDFCTQSIRAGMERLDAILYTHAHADHILGLDDVRPLNQIMGGPIPIYGNRPALAGLHSIFQYIYDGNWPWGGVTQITDHLIEKRFELFGLEVIPIPVIHGRMEVLGFRFGPVAYLTDYNEIPASSARLLKGVDTIFLDALRHLSHPTHMTVAQALEQVKRLNPRQAWLTHIAHDLGHRETNAALPSHVRLCHDGMQLEFDI